MNKKLLISILIPILVGLLSNIDRLVNVFSGDKIIEKEEIEYVEKGKKHKLYVESTKKCKDKIKDCDKENEKLKKRIILNEKNIYKQNIYVLKLNCKNDFLEKEKKYIQNKYDSLINIMKQSEINIIKQSDTFPTKIQHPSSLYIKFDVLEEKYFENELLKERDTICIEKFENNNDSLKIEDNNKKWKWNLIEKILK